uniref:Uncharacterized protein n=1 Tax=Calcidiscus leptoporus TaxID=127549 RepID=A0A7S0IQZ8_9EUKA
MRCSPSFAPRHTACRFGSVAMVDPGAALLLGGAVGTGAVESIGTTLAFADQSGKLAGTFFANSLPSYIAFLYFLGYEKNRTPKVAMFGFQFLLLFVMSTIFTGIVTKGTYASTLADVDWLHGAAEALLTTSNLYVAFGFRSAMAGEKQPEGPSFRYPAFAVFALVVLATAAGPAIGFEAHSAFLGGIGNLGSNPLGSLAAAEPANALSVPTWAIHFSSVFEWLFAMSAVSTYAAATGNERWRWLAWGMLPLHASGVAACTYHFFYNSQDVGFLVTLQAFLTLVGNTTVAIAALLIALSNGWSINELNPFADGRDPLAAIKARFSADGDGSLAAATQASTDGWQPSALAIQEYPPAALLAAELAALTIACSYLMKYGEPALGVPFAPNALVAWLMVASVPAAVAYSIASTPAPAAVASAGGGGSFADAAAPPPAAETSSTPAFSMPEISMPEISMPKFGGSKATEAAEDEAAQGLSMEDIKKYGVAGTVAYILTELAFWAVAFPVASAALYQTSGHWPDFSDNVDRATVVGFVFAGANIARLAVPLRFAAAFALAPWVDENVIARFKADSGEA